MSDSTDNGPVLSADGTPLKRSLKRSLRLQKFRALLLIAPLLAFILITFIAPIADMLFRSVENKIVEETLPQTVALIDTDGEIESIVPSEKVFSALYVDMFVAAENKEHTRLGTRLNYEESGISSLFRKSGRRVSRLDVEVYKDQFEDVDPSWTEIATWQSLADDATARELLPRAMWAYDAWRDYVIADGDNPDEEALEDLTRTGLTKMSGKPCEPILRAIQRGIF